MPEDRLQVMLDAMATAPPEVLPSKFWVELNAKNMEQLAESGYEHFKRTVATNYFTWVVPLHNPQIRFLLFHLPLFSVIRNGLDALRSARHPPLSRHQSILYNFLTLMLWEYVSRHDGAEYLARLEEPTEGDPPRLFHNGRLISQDLANATLEFISSTGNGALPQAGGTVLELGAGYGRTAFVFLRLLPGVRYVVADIPPALYICERYLCRVFPERRVFRFRDFRNYSDIEAEFRESEIAFFLPHQLEMLPPGLADLAINISSLHEMRMDQIAYYLRLLDRLTRGQVYLKEWKVSVNAAETLTVRETDYPIPSTWSRVFWRECEVQTEFFEALFAS